MSETLYDDFLGGSSETGEVGSLGWSHTSAGTGGVARSASSADHPGIVALASGNVSGDVTSLHLGTSASQVTIDVGAVLRMAWTARLVATTSQRARLGLGTDLGAANWGAGGVWFRYDSGISANWFFVVRSGGVSASTDTGVAASTSWLTLACTQVPAGTWNWSILDTSGTETTGTVSAGAPAAGTVLVVGASIETLTAAAKTLAIDEFGLRYARAGARKYLGG